MSEPTSPQAPFRSGYVAIIGPPNAGKSTLLNRLLNRHLSIVAPRPQTTRHRVLGILNGPGFQALFLDTPGLLDPKYALQRLMRGEIEAALADADVVVAVVDATSARDNLEPVIAALRGRKAAVAVNKVDHVADKKNLLPLMERFADAGFTSVFPVSALRGGGLEELKQAIVRLLPEGPPFYPDDTVSERNERFFVAEFVRECIFNLYGEEVPYACAVAIEEFKERPGRKDYVRAVVYVEKESQKAILIGKDGRALKRVGERARRRIESFLERPVYLELWVKVAEDWRENERFVRENVYGKQ